ncbi:hypothetical protein QQX09_04740 [Demequina sp. SYSU T00192]|uniref:Uncharacterized protein n=1 Tax=Demequina litoralis TaxID=3051660 RepID=A0ABT8G7R4_9MICO|nr:hypothetical protein [Demequina sp. SYSU T00192]MDN4475165.1 hypothetical protein [Demequina sp. SYSU T00192]
MRALLPAWGRSRREDFPAPVLLHIGIPKSATTAVQNGLAKSRRKLRKAGILYPELDGRINHHHLAVQLMGRRHGAWNPTGDSLDLLERLKRDASAPGVTQVVLSSELLAEIDITEARKVLSHLGDDVRILITLRSIPQLLPSSWQQGASAGHQEPFEDWLREVLRDPAKLDLRPLMSMRGDDGYTLMTRWKKLVGAKNITVLIPDPEDRTSVFAEMEELLGLDQGTLRQFSSNTSLSFTQSEFTRLTGAATRQHLTSFERVQLVQQGMGNGMKRGTGTKGRPATLPAWALDAAQEAGRALARSVKASRATVLGDLDVLSAEARTGADEPYAQPTEFPLSMVIDGLAGGFRRATEAPFASDDAMRPVVRAPRVEGIGEPLASDAQAVPLAFSGSAGLGRVAKAARTRLHSAAEGHALTRLKPGRDLRDGPAVVAVEPAATTAWRLYQSHLIDGGAQTWAEFAAGLSLARDDAWWQERATMLQALAARSDAPAVVTADDNAALAAACHALEAALGAPAGAVAGLAHGTPGVALLSVEQAAILRGFNAAIEGHGQEADRKRLVANGLVSSLTARAPEHGSLPALPPEVAEQARLHDARMAALLAEAGLAVPASPPAGDRGHGDPDAVEVVSADDAVAAAAGIIRAARAVSQAARKRAAARA